VKRVRQRIVFSRRRITTVRYINIRGIVRTKSMYISFPNAIGICSHGLVGNLTYEITGAKFLGEHQLTQFDLASQ